MGKPKSAKHPPERKKKKSILNGEELKEMGVGRGRTGMSSPSLALPLTSVHTTDQECKRPATPRTPLLDQSWGRRKVPRRRQSPGCGAWRSSFPAARRAAPGRAAGARGRGRRGRRARYSPAGGWRRRSAEAGAGCGRLRSALGRAPSRRRLLGRCPRLPARVAGGASPAPESRRLPREWAGAVGLRGRSCVLL